MKKLFVFVVLAVTATLVVARQPLRPGKFLLFPDQPVQVDRESTHHFDVRLYQVNMNLPMNNGAMQGHLRVELTPRHDNFDTFSLHMVNLVCDSIRRAGNACTFTTPSGRLLVDLDRTFANGESLSVDIYYHRNSGTSNRGFYWYARGSSGIPHAICYSTTEPSDARYWLPCFDEPWDKAERGCRINLTVPDSLHACSNGLLDSVTTNAGNRTKTYWWRENYPISTYLMTFAASKWASFKQWFHHTPSESTYVQNFIWPEDSSAAASSFQNTVDMMYYYADSLIYGRYPFEKYGMVEAYPFSWGGMENQTMTMVHQWWVQGGDDNGIAHELSHMWWGDMVTCLDWRNIWLNEGFATYSDEMYEYHQNGRAAFLSMISSRASDYIDEEAGDPHPIYNPPYPDHLFDWGHSYCKGAWVQHMLRYVVGDTSWANPGMFYRGMRAYGDSFKYGGANSDDYRRVHERMSGLTLDWFFNEWVYAYGYPIYTVGWQGRQTGDGWEVVLDLEQNNSSGAPDVFHMPMEVKVNWSGGSATFRYDVTSNPQRNVFPVAAQPTSIQVDPNDWILDRHSTRVGVSEGEVPAGLVRARLAEVVPNPARGGVRLSYVLPRAGEARLEVFDSDGRMVRTLAAGRSAGGRQTVVWNRTDDAGQRVPAGVYVVRFSAGPDRVSRKLVLTD